MLKHRPSRRADAGNADNAENGKELQINAEVLKIITFWCVRVATMI